MLRGEDMIKVKVATLGPEGTFSERVARENYEDAKISLTPEISTIFDLVTNGEVDYGVVPIEDNVEGDVRGALDLFRFNDVFITKEFHLEVRHCLLGTGKIEDLVVIGSHPQALRHCRKYLDTKFPNLTRKQTLSTAEAAKMASKDPTFGAIADERVAEIYGLNILERDIHDYGSNTTRFFAIAASPQIPPTTNGSTKTSIIVYPHEDRPGVLYDILEEFKEQDINLTKIVSMPSRGSLGGHIFYADFEGTQADANVNLALEHLESSPTVETIRRLGSFTFNLTDKEIEEISTPRLKIPRDTIVIEGAELDIDASDLDIGVFYPISYLGGKYFICRPKRGTLQIYEGQLSENT